jgi:hypothetical protein
MTLALALVRVVLGYLTAGFLFALWFAWKGAGRLDPVAAGGSPGFRLLIIPGATLLWLPLAVRLVRIRSRGQETG